MPVKRISLQLRTNTSTAEAKPAVSQTSPTPSLTSQENTSQAAKAESGGKIPRPSRLKPTVPLHMTTRRHKSELELAAHTQPNQATKPESPKIERGNNNTTTTAQKMPPKRVSSAMSEAQEPHEQPKKRLRGLQQTPKTNGASQSVASSTSKQANDTSRTETIKSTSMMSKRPRGRPPLKPKPSTPSEKGDITANTPTSSRKEPSPAQTVMKQSIDGNSNTVSSTPSGSAGSKVSRKAVYEQYHQKQQLALKYATTEQLRRRQARIQQQYSLLAQLAKKNNTFLIDKSIEILNNISDVDLARTEWVASILAGLEKAEEARMEQIHFEKKIGLINAFHTYDAERQRIEDEYKVSTLRECYKVCY